jgi:hypothetical protein
MLLMRVNNLLHFIITTHEDTAAVVDVFGLHGCHTPHLAVDCLATSCGVYELANLLSTAN